MLHGLEDVARVAHTVLNWQPNSLCSISHPCHVLRRCSYVVAVVRYVIVRGRLVIPLESNRRLRPALAPHLVGVRVRAFVKCNGRSPNVSCCARVWWVPPPACSLLRVRLSKEGGCNRRVGAPCPHKSHGASFISRRNGQRDVMQ